MASNVSRTIERDTSSLDQCQNIVRSVGKVAGSDRATTNNFGVVRAEQTVPRGTHRIGASEGILVNREVERRLNLRHNVLLNVHDDSPLRVFATVLIAATNYYE
jgi:hypothetical protein